MANLVLYDFEIQVNTIDNWFIMSASESTKMVFMCYMYSIYVCMSNACPETASRKKTLAKHMASCPRVSDQG